MSHGEQTDRDDRTADAVPTNPEPAGEKPQVFALLRNGSSWALSRRGFLTGGTAAAGTALAAGCGGGDDGNSSATAASAPAGAADLSKKKAASPDDCRGVAHAASIHRIALSLDGRFLASAGSDSRVKIWSIPDGALVHTLAAATSRSRGLAISHDGRYVILAATTGRVQFWDLSQAKPIASTFTVNRYSQSFAFIARKDLLAVGDTQGHVSLYAIPGGERKTQFSADRFSTMDLLHSSFDGGWVSAVDNRQHNVHFWSVPDGKTHLTLKSPQLARLTAFDISRAEAMSVAGDSRGSGYIWRGAAVDPKHNFVAGQRAVLAARVTADGKRIVTFDAASSCRSFTPDGVELGNFTLSGVSGPVAAEITPDGKYVIVAYSKSIAIAALDKKSREKCLMDVAASSSDSTGIKYQGKDAFGHTVTYTLPCGSPIPAGAVCTCNCVPGSIRVSTPRTYTTYRRTYSPSPRTNTTYRRTYSPRTYTTYRTYSPRTYTIRYWYPN